MKAFSYTLNLSFKSGTERPTRQISVGAVVHLHKASLRLSRRFFYTRDTAQRQLGGGTSLRGNNSQIRCARRSAGFSVRTQRRKGWVHGRQ